MKQIQILFFFLFSVLPLTAQTVSNVRTTFSSCHISVQYDLTATNPVNVTLEYSGDGGTTWIPAVTVTGDLAGQTTGNNKRISWDNHADNIRHGLFDFRVVLPPVEQEECVWINGVCWATRNVGMPGTFVDNPEDAGMFYQWNRNIGWSATNPIINSNGGTTWDGSTPAGTTWETANEVCPAGYRVPTQAEFQSLVNSGSIWVSNWNHTGVTGRVFGSGDNTLFLPAAGFRYNTSGALDYAGTGGYYWSSTVSGSNASSLFFNSSLSFMSNFTRAWGLSLRCVADN